MLFKIAPAPAWHQTPREGCLPLSADDARDGFIHLSTREQLEGTLRKHFADQDDLVLLRIDALGVEDILRWEVSRGGQLFPHLYGELPHSAVLQVWPLPLQDGVHQLPEL